jgi:hypothetical protein
MIKERERQRKVRKVQECKTTSIPEHRWESSEEEEDVTAPGLIQGNVDSGPGESEDDKVIVSEGEELGQANESIFALLMASAIGI